MIVNVMSYGKVTTVGSDIASKSGRGIEPIGPIYFYTIFI
jgi:hypothetical protein